MRNVIVADSREAAEKESGDVILSGARVYAEIGEILAGTRPRPAPGQTVIFKALGQAVADAVAAKLVCDRAEIR
jgi:thiomorpholine-carboxylate dehydrogenase